MMRVAKAVSDRRTVPDAAAGQIGLAGSPDFDGAVSSPWVRALAGDMSGVGFHADGTVHGLAIGMDVDLGGGFRVGTSVAPDAESSFGLEKRGTGVTEVVGDFYAADIG